MALPGLPITVGCPVVRRERLSARHAYRVTAIGAGEGSVARGGANRPHHAVIL